MQYASLKNIDTKAVRAELITLALASLLADAGERVTVLGSGMRPTSGRVAVRRVAETLFDEGRTGKTPPSLPPLLPLPAHGTVVLVSDWLDPLDNIEAVIRHYASGGVRGHLVQVLDPAEEDLPFDGPCEVRGPRGRGATHDPPRRRRATGLRRAAGRRRRKACSGSHARPIGRCTCIAPTSPRRRCCCRSISPWPTCVG
jgi:hypothetical protein